MLERNVTNCMCVMVSLLKSWKVYVIGIECDDAAF